MTSSNAVSDGSVSESTAMLSVGTRGGGSAFRGRGRDSGGGRSSGRGRGTRSCSHSGRNNHSSDKCWDKFGKPANQVTVSSTTEGSQSTAVPSDDTIVLSREEYEKLTRGVILSISNSKSLLQRASHPGPYASSG